MNFIVAAVICLALGAEQRSDRPSPATAIDSICARASARSDSALAGVWNRVRAVAATHSIAHAVGILDSVRINTAELPDSFGNDYADFSAYGLLSAPSRPGGKRDYNLRSVLTAIGESWAEPVTTYWRAVRSDSGSALPNIVFGARYDVPRGTRLRMRLVDSPSMRLRLEVSDAITEQLVGPLFHTPFRAPRQVDVKVMVSFGGPGAVDVDEYVNGIIAGAFDKVVARNDLGALDAISVQCVRKSPFRGHADEIQRYVVFDLPVRRRRQTPAEPALRPVPSADTLFARYVVAVRGAEDVSDKAEALLQRVLAHFAAL